MNHRLNIEEINERARELARLLSLLRDERAAAKQDQLSHNTIIRSLETQITSLVAIIQSGEEHRESQLELQMQ